MVLQFCPWNKLVILSLQILMFSQSWSKIVSVAWKATNHISTKCLNCIWSPKPTESPQFEFVDSLFYHCYIFDFQAKICQQMYEENFNMIGNYPPLPLPPPPEGSPINVYSPKIHLFYHGRKTNKVCCEEMSCWWSVNGLLREQVINKRGGQLWGHN